MERSISRALDPIIREINPIIFLTSEANSDSAVLRSLFAWTSSSGSKKMVWPDCDVSWRIPLIAPFAEGLKGRACLPPLTVTYLSWRCFWYAGDDIILFAVSTTRSLADSILFLRTGTRGLAESLISPW